MDVRALRYFTEVVRQQSFTRAAQKLFVTQPTISKMVRQLEEELDCALLIRDGRRLHLTDSGQAVYQRGLAILQEFHQLEAEIGDINQLKTGKLRLGIPRWWACRSPDRFRRFAVAIRVWNSVLLSLVA